MAKAEFDVMLYETSNGDCPVQDFLDSLDDKMAAKMYGMIKLLEEYGPRTSCSDAIVCIAIYC